MTGERTLEPVGLAEALHDASNALTVVLGWLEEAGREGQPEPFVRRAIEIAAKKAREARALSREAIGAAPPREQPRGASAILREVVEALAVEAERAGVTIRLESSGDDPQVACGAPLGHMVTNLVLNALAWSPRGGAVVVAGRSVGRELVIHVIDQGPGIPADLAPTLFTGGSKRAGGAGIGLRHARQTARKLGGDLRLVEGPALAELAATLALGAGAVGGCFELRVPNASTQSEIPRNAGSSQTLRSAVVGTRVLVVEDDRAVCALLDAGLGARGCEVIAVHDDHTLRQRLSTIGVIDAVLLDLSPIATDIEGAIAAVRAAHPDAGIVFISGSSTIAAAQIAEVTPRTRWVRKPFELAEITAAIAELLPRRG
ncbi:MAG: hybrid sensor histidine kinase/response regulator [Myxococcales bacterium]|nr:hybrid sensor histidine kinase/response regulator [Myxococcales bacterium]